MIIQNSTTLSGSLKVYKIEQAKFHILDRVNEFIKLKLRTVRITEVLYTVLVMTGFAWTSKLTNKETFKYGETYDFKL